MDPDNPFSVDALATSSSDIAGLPDDEVTVYADEGDLDTDELAIDAEALSAEEDAKTTMLHLHKCAKAQGRSIGEILDLLRQVKK